MDTVTSADGTTIAYERMGERRPLVLVGGALCDRSALAPLGDALAGEVQAITYDRRGRGDSGDTRPYDVSREVEDVAALVDAVGGEADVYGHSSGAGLALEAAAAGIPFGRVVLHEPPYGEDTEEERREALRLGIAVRELLAAGRGKDAVAEFLGDQLPPEALAELLKDPHYEGIAPTLEYDFAVMGAYDTGSVVPVDKVRTIAQPTLVLYGSASPEFFAAAASLIAQELPDGRLEVLADQHHGVPPEVLAPYLRAFLQA